MNAPNKYTPLIENLLELEEDTVLSMVRNWLETGYDPLEIIAAAQEAMALVGERYERREYYISGMMMAGEIFREVMELVEPILVEQMDANGSGHILLGTVQGDIHDIGKNIFSTLLRSNGFTVTDLGVDVPPERFVQEALRLQPHIIALSGLLTISYDAMKSTVEMVQNLEDSATNGTPFIIGGGTVNAMVGAFVGADYWASDAMFGVQLCKQIIAERNISTE